MAEGHSAGADAVTVSSPSLVVDTLVVSPSSTAASSNTSLAVDARDVKTTLSSKTSAISLAVASELDDVQTEILIQKKRAHARLVRLREVVDDGGDALYTFVGWALPAEVPRPAPRMPPGPVFVDPCI